MRQRWLGIFALAVLPVFLPRGLGVSSAEALAGANPTATGISNTVIVQYAPASNVEAQTAAGKPPSLEAQGFRTLSVPRGMTRANYMAQLKREPGVLSVEPNEPVYAADIPNDPYYLPNQAQYLSAIGAPQAWSLETGAHSVVVAVLDSGIDLNHPDLARQIWNNPRANNDGTGCINDFHGCRYVTLTPQNAATCGYTAASEVPNGNVMDDNGTGPSDPGSHGTFVSGIIGATGDNGIGVTGVDWNVQIMPIKVLDCGSGPGGLPEGSVADVAAGIDYARLMGAQIINLSLAAQQDRTILRTAIQQAQAAGIIIVAAAGNFGSTSQPGPGYPAAYSTQFSNVVAVGAADNLNGNTWAPYSAYGPSIDFAAPGNGITSTIRSDIGLPIPYGEVGSASDNFAGGTSFATPFVTGMFALMMARNPDLPTTEYISLAREAASPAPPGPPNWAGAGIINIGKAVALVPMTISGAALHNWLNVPAGTDVRADVGGVTCGDTSAVSSGGESEYTIRVASDAQLPGCGAPGRTIQISVGGQPASPTIPWGGRNANLNLDQQDVSSISPEPGPVVVQQLSGGWSNIAQLGPSGPPSVALFSLPEPWTAAYLYDPFLSGIEGTGTYLRYLPDAPAYASDWSQVQTYDAFWVNGPPANFASANPDPAPGRTIHLHEGWNNFTYTGKNRAVAEALSSISGEYTEVAQYDNASGEWLMYTPGALRNEDDFGGLFALQVYWVYMSRGGLLTMQ